MLDGDGTEVTTVAALGTVITKDEHESFLNGRRLSRFLREDSPPGVTLTKRFVIEVYHFTDQFNFVSSDSDHAFDQVALGTAGDLVQDHDIATVRVMESVRHLVDEHAVAGAERRVHRRPLDDEVGEEERPHDDGDEQGDRHDQRPFTECPRPSAEATLVGNNLMVDVGAHIE